MVLSEENCKRCTKKVLEAHAGVQYLLKYLKASECLGVLKGGLICYENCPDPHVPLNPMNIPSANANLNKNVSNDTHTINEQYLNKVNGVNDSSNKNSGKGHGLKGYYNPEYKRIIICCNNINNIKELEETILHEMV